MFSDTERCPCIFARTWSSHEASCAAAGHDCTACRYCMANITYWGRADEVLRGLASNTSASQKASSSSTSTSTPRVQEEERLRRAAATDAQRRYSASQDAGMPPRGGGKSSGRRSSVRWKEEDPGK